MIGGRNDKRIFIDSKLYTYSRIVSKSKRSREEERGAYLLQVSENRLDCVVELEQFTHSSLHVGSVHSLVD